MSEPLNPGDDLGKDEEPAQVLNAETAAAKQPPAAMRNKSTAVLNRMFQSIQHTMDGIQQRLQTLERQMHNVMCRGNETANHTEQLLQGQRLAADQRLHFMSKVDRMASKAANREFREFAEGLLLVYDLTAGIAQSADDDKNVSASSVCRMLARQIQQLLAAHGIEQVPAVGEPNYDLHRPVETVVVEEPDRVNQILEVRRPGFRIGDRVLRVADVVISVARPPELEVVVRKSDHSTSSSDSPLAPAKSPSTPPAETPDAEAPSAKTPSTDAAAGDSSTAVTSVEMPSASSEPAEGTAADSKVPDQRPL